MDKPIRVLHVIGIMNRGGAETMIMNLYRNIDRGNVQFDFVENEGDEAAFDTEIKQLGGRIYHCPRYNGKNHFTYTRWWNSFFASHKGEYPIVHGHIGSTAAIYLSIAKKYGVYTIAHSHNTNAQRSMAQYIYSIFSYPTRYTADHFFACSPDAAVDRFGEHVAKDSKKCEILRNAIDSYKFRFDPNIRSAIRNRLNIKDTAIVIGNVARFAPQKNHMFLIDVFRTVHKKNPDAVLLLVGDGELRPQIEQVIAENKLYNNVIFAGVQSNIGEFYQAMDVCVFPSLYEGLGIVVIEAQAAGLPCCVSDAVPAEAALTSLVEHRSLHESTEAWADWILKRSHSPRRDTAEAIRNAGYDIAETSVWLETFYTKVVNEHG